MWSFAALCDEFYVRSRLYLKLDLNPSRESLLHFFEQIQKAFPGMARLTRYDDGAVVLRQRAGEEESLRYVRIAPNALKFGMSAPRSADDVHAFANVVLRQAPAHLTLSDLDNDYLEVVLGFDLEYSGNHDELVSEALLGENPLLGVLTGGATRVINCQPALGVALTADCATQAQVSVRSRTSAFEVRSGDYEPAPLSVYLNVRRYWGGSANGLELADVHRDLLETASEIAAGQVLPRLVQPLAEAIASRR